LGALRGLAEASDGEAATIAPTVAAIATNAPDTLEVPTCCSNLQDC